MAKEKVTVDVAGKGPGRPPVFTGFLEKQIVRLVRSNGLVGARKLLAEVGVQKRAFGKVEPVNVSLPTLGKLAARNGVKLQRGRPKVAA